MGNTEVNNLMDNLNMMIQEKAETEKSSRSIHILTLATTSVKERLHIGLDGKALVVP